MILLNKINGFLDKIERHAQQLFPDSLLARENMTLVVCEFMIEQPDRHPHEYTYPSLARENSLSFLNEFAASKARFLQSPPQWSKIRPETPI